MTQHSYNDQVVKLSTPGDYIIEVAGEIEKTFGERLGGMRITAQRGQAKAIVTTLTGWLRDQAELLGVLNSLYDMHFSILLVKRLSDR